MVVTFAVPAAAQTIPWFDGRSFESYRDEFDRRGFLVFERVLSPDTVAAIRVALAPHLARDLKGRNDFEGERTNRVYALMSKSPVFAELAIHPLALAFAEAVIAEIPSSLSPRKLGTRHRRCQYLGYRILGVAAGRWAGWP